MGLDTRIAQTQLENALRNAILLAMGRRLPAVATVAALRALKSRGDSGGNLYGDDALISVVVGGNVTAAYRWSAESSAADDGAGVVKPTDVTSGPGRWLLWTSPLRHCPVVGGNSFFLHELATGFLERVVVLDKGMTSDEVEALILGQAPCVTVEATGDDPEDATLDVGHRWLTDYSFTISVISQNLRERREAAQGSVYSADGADPGANAIDGWIKALLAGTGMYAVIDGIRAVRLGSCRNLESDLAERRVVRQREYVVQVTEENPAAPNDTGAAQEIDAQAELADLGSPPAASFDINNYVVSGMAVADGAGFVKTVSAGSALIADLTVTYAGQLKTFTAFRDTYRDLLPNGTMTFVEAATEGAAPAVTATALRVGVTRTNGSGIVSDRITAPTKASLLPNYQHPLS